MNELVVSSPEEALGRVTGMVEVLTSVREQMQEDRDYGVIPGTKNPTLLKPGAVRIMNALNLRAEFETERVIEDYKSEEPFFMYTIKCRLYHIPTSALVGEGIGSCNSWEDKYRWRQSNRKCPSCGKEAIFKGKAEWGGKWYCNTKVGGCNAKFDANDPAITSQQIGRIPNPDIFNILNTLLKMAQKRALIGAVLNATSASDSFTQDMEDVKGMTQYDESALEDIAMPSQPQRDRRTEAQKLLEMYSQVNWQGMSVREALQNALGGSYSEFKGTFEQAKAIIEQYRKDIQKEPLI